MSKYPMYLPKLITNSIYATLFNIAFMISNETGIRQLPTHTRVQNETRGTARASENQDGVEWERG